MNTTTEHFITIIENETRALNGLSSEPVDYGGTLSTLCASLYLCSKTLRKLALYEFNENSDKAMRLINAIEHVQEGIKSARQKMGNKAFIGPVPVKKSQC